MTSNLQSPEEVARKIIDSSLCVGNVDYCCEIHWKKSDIEKVLKKITQALRSDREAVREKARKIAAIYQEQYAVGEEETDMVRRIAKAIGEMEI